MLGKVKRFYLLGSNISKLGLGTMRLPMRDGVIDQQEVNLMVKYALEHGVNYFDTAFVYHGGKSESALGEALKPFDRTSYHLATKMTLWEADSRVYLESKFNESLEKLQTEYIDFYLMHSLNEYKYDKAKTVGAVEWALEKKKDGKIKHLGFSIHDGISLLKRVLTDYDWDFAQIQYNYMDTDGEPGQEGYEELARRNIPVMIMEPLKGGILADIPESLSKPFKALGGSNVEYAFRWFLDYEHIGVILSGMSSLGQVIDNVNLFSKMEPLTESERLALIQVRENIKSSQKVPCTACQYCMPCTAEIDIPGSFSAWHLRSLQKARKWVSGNSIDTEAIKGCINCGICTDRCPQKIDIPDKLRTLLADCGLGN